MFGVVLQFQIVIGDLYDLVATVINELIDYNLLTIILIFYI